jgi:hypothetical protein
VRVKSDSHRGTGQEVWQLESYTYPGNCVLGGCRARMHDWAGPVRVSMAVATCTTASRFSSLDKATQNVYQLKDIKAWEDKGVHTCLGTDGNVVYLVSSCNGATTYWDAVGY